MDTASLLSKLEKAAPRAIIEKQKFGKADTLCVWVETKDLGRFARAIRDDATLKFDWLENVSAMQLDEALVLSFFLRSSRSGAQLVLRVSVAPDSKIEPVSVVSVSDVWPLAVEYEVEIRDLFGVEFTGSVSEAGRGERLLPEGWDGYPLRKGYVFPSEVGGVRHARSKGGTA